MATDKRTSDLGDLWHAVRLHAWRLAYAYGHRMGAITAEGISRCELCGSFLTVRHPADYDQPGIVAGPAWRPCPLPAVPTLRRVPTTGRLAYMNEQRGR